MTAYTPAEIRAVLGIPASTLRQWIARGHITKSGRGLYDGDSVIARWRDSEAAAASSVDTDADAPADLSS